MLILMFYIILIKSCVPSKVQNLVQKFAVAFFGMRMANFNQFFGLGQIAYGIGQQSVVEIVRRLYLVLTLEITPLLRADVYRGKNEDLYFQKTLAISEK